MSKRYRAVVYIKGAMNQSVYGSDLERLERNAAKLLTEHPDGWACTHPLRYVLQEQVRIIDGNSAEWKNVKTVEYKDLPK